MSDDKKPVVLLPPVKEDGRWVPWIRFPMPILPHTFEEALHLQLQETAVRTKRCAFRTGWFGAVMTIDMQAKIDEAWEKHGGECVQQRGAQYAVWVGPEGVVSYQSDDTGTTWEASAFNIEVLNELRALTGKPGDPDSVLTVRVLEADNGEYYFSELKAPPSPFVRSNYSEKIATEYDVVLAGITAPNPPGRLTLLSGEPGTGKSHFVRGLLEDSRDKATFCLVPPHMLTQITGPDLIGALRGLREPHRRRRRRGASGAMDEGATDKTIVIVLEDADSCLVPRGSDNMPLIATILNMSDGIFGAALDLRLIATTNAKSFEVDPALERPGRLLAHVLFERLTQREANTVRQRLGAPRQSEAGKAITLADVYAQARKVMP